MPRTPKPENKIFDELRPHVDAARSELGLTARGYRKRDGDTEYRLVYGVKFEGKPPYYFADAKPEERNVRTSPWEAIWLAVGSSGASQLEVLVQKSVSKKDAEDTVSVKKVGETIKVPAAFDLFPERTEGAGTPISKG